MAAYATYGLQIAQGVAGFMIGSIEARLAATLQKYRNQILKVQEAMNAQRITLNEISTQDAAMRMSFALQMQSASDMGGAEVAAAAAGVKGANVNNVMRGLRRSEASAQFARKSRLQEELWSHWEDRRSNALATVMATEITVHTGPSIFSAAVGVATNLLETSQANQTITEKRGPSKVGPRPSTALGLGATTAGTLLDDPSDYWKIPDNHGPNG